MGVPRTGPGYVAGRAVPRMVRAMLPLSMVSVRAAEGLRNLQVHHPSAESSRARDGCANVLLLDGTWPSDADVAPAEAHIQAAGCGFALPGAITFQRPRRPH